MTCPNCGAQELENKNFCRHCGARLHVVDDEATTWRLPAAGSAKQTSQVKPQATGEPSASTGPAYVPPSPPVRYYQERVPPSPPTPVAGHVNISLGDWLAGGWQVFKENWGLMFGASMLAAVLSLGTFGILAGPLLMGLYRMAFKTIRGEQPEIGDLFKWKGRFLQSFLTFLIFAAIHIGLTSAGDGGLFAILSFLIDPLLTISMALSMPLILERKVDVVAAINEVGRLIFSRDALMWWVVGLVLLVIGALGFFGCFIGVFITTPWMIATAAVAYRDLFGLEDPNRTLP